MIYYQIKVKLQKYYQEMKMIDNKYKNFITKIIGLNSNLDWQYAITDSSNNNDLLNSVAFSFIPKEEKINLFNL